MDKNKELAVEAATEFVKSWNSNSGAVPMDTSEFCEALKQIYSVICSLDAERVDE